MARVRYSSIIQTETFEALRPQADDLRRLRNPCRRGSIERALLDSLLRVLGSAAYHFTGRPNFYDPR
jgi:hypothetical protein